MKNRILILGATGLLGVPLSNYLEEKGWKVIRHSLRTKSDYAVDLRDPRKTWELMENVRPDTIINLVALTDVDMCEQNPFLAYQLNILPVENLIQWLLENQKSNLIHISTDMVYDAPGPSPENDVSPKNIYSYSKYCAEHAALRVDSTILRTNFFGKSRTPGKQSFSDWLLESFQTKTELKLFKDVLFSPLSMHTLSEMIHVVIEHEQPGVYNFGSHDGMSKRDFAVNLAEMFHVDMGRVSSVSVRDVDLKAYRPTDMRMDCSLFEKTFNVKLPSLKEEMETLSGRNM